MALQLVLGGGSYTTISSRSFSPLNDTVNKPHGINGRIKSCSRGHFSSGFLPPHALRQQQYLQRIVIYIIGRLKRIITKIV